MTIPFAYLKVLDDIPTLILKRFTFKLVGHNSEHYASRLYNRAIFANSMSMHMIGSDRDE